MEPDLSNTAYSSYNRYSQLPSSVRNEISSAYVLNSLERFDKNGFEGLFEPFPVCIPVAWAHVRPHVREAYFVEQRFSNGALAIWTVIPLPFGFLWSRLQDRRTVNPKEDAQEFASFATRLPAQLHPLFKLSEKVGVNWSNPYLGIGDVFLLYDLFEGGSIDDFVKGKRRAQIKQMFNDADFSDLRVFAFDEAETWKVFFDRSATSVGSLWFASEKFKKVAALNDMRTIYDALCAHYLSGNTTSFDFSGYLEK